MMSKQYTLIFEKAIVTNSLLEFLLACWCHVLV